MPASRFPWVDKGLSFFPAPGSGHRNPKGDFPLEKGYQGTADTRYTLFEARQRRHPC